MNIILRLHKFIDYANQYGLEAARTKIKDSKLLEQYIKAYCDKFDLDYLSVSKALESVAKVKKGISLLSKYTIICDTIKTHVSGGQLEALIAAGYFDEDTIKRMYLSSAAKVLTYVRSECMSNTYSSSEVSSKINAIKGQKNGTQSLTNEYISSMNIHASDMKGYIQSGKGLYKPVQQWYSTGTYSSGVWETVYLHQDGEALRVLDSPLYQDSVKTASWVQGNLTTFSFLSTLVTTGGIAAFNGLVNGFKSFADGHTIIHIDKTNPMNYAFDGGALSQGSSISISVSLSDLEAFAMTLTKEQQLVLGYSFAAIGVGSGMQGGGSSPSNQNIDDLIDDIPSEYKQNFKCKEFKDSLIEKLDQKGIKYEVVELKSDFNIYSDYFKESIARGNSQDRSSYHFGVKIGDKIYDNMYSRGVDYNYWLSDLGVDGVTVRIV